MDKTLTDDDWRRLGKAAEGRRLELGYTQERLVELGGPSHQTVRNIERGASTECRPLTLRKLDRALQWPSGTSAKILEGVHTAEPASGATQLAEAVSRRRAQLGRTQEAMPAHGGPSGRTVRAIEQAQLPRFTAALLAKLDRGLDWPDGTAAKILEGGDSQSIAATSTNLCQTVPMNAELLAQAVRDRRAWLNNLTQAQVAERGGPSTETMRLIEKGEGAQYNGRTLDRLDRALDWPRATSDRLLRGTVDSDELPRLIQYELPTDGSCQELAEAVRRRREQMGLRQVDLEDFGGPSSGTVRNIEQAARETYSSKTKMQIERALQWRTGLVDDILQGKAADDEVYDEVKDSPPSNDRPAYVGPAADFAKQTTIGTIAANIQALDQLQPRTPVISRTIHYLARALVECVTAELDAP